MPIPTYQELMLPLLKAVADQAKHLLTAIVPKLEEEFNLSPEERQMLLPSGQDTLFHNRVTWARTYLKKAGLLESPRRGRIRITPLGLEVLAQNPPTINNAFLMQFESFRQFIEESRSAKAVNQSLHLLPKAPRRRS